MKKFFFCFLISLCVVSCGSVDVQKAVKTSTGKGRQRNVEVVTVPVPIDVEPVVIEKPVYIPQGAAAQRNAAQGRAAVESSNRDGIMQPQDYSHAAVLYDYNRDYVYEVYCQPLRLTDITLKPEEKILDPPFISDSERWMVGAGISYEDGLPIQHVYVKPTSANLEASLIINTENRVYRLILRSFTNVHMPLVRWKYPEEALPRNFMASSLPSGRRQEDASLSADPRFLSFNYRITYGIFKKPRWLPTLVYDDGKKTYIVFPDSVLQAELPAVFENRSDVLNYRVTGNVMIVDKLVRKCTVKLDDCGITVEKKKGNR